MFKPTKILKVFTVASTAFLLPLVIGSANPQSSLGTVAVAQEEKKRTKI